MAKTDRLKLKVLLIIFFLFTAITIVATSCVCPLFSFFERLTGFEIKVGENIDQSLVANELIYPDSVALVQVDGDIERIVELIGQYGVNLSEEELAIFDELPQEIKDQEISATVYSTADDGARVLDYYYSLNDKGWVIQELKNGQQIENSVQPSMLIAFKGDIRQAFMLAETNNNTFIIFIDFDWEMISQLEEQ